MKLPARNKKRNLDLELWSSSSRVVARRVTPEKERDTYCLEHREKGVCACYKAKYEQQCQCCKCMLRIGDCTQNLGYGWVHCHCDQDDNRGLPSIRRGFIAAVNLGLALEDEAPSVNARRTLTLEDESVSDEKQNSAAASDEDADEEESSKKGSTTATTLAAHHDETAQQQEHLTKEQSAIIQFRPTSGDVVCVNALAGCGKTTTISLICNQFHERYSILYLVFNRKNQDEASDSGKFPRSVEIRTTHAYVLRHYFGVHNMHNVKKTEAHVLDDIIDAANLTADVQVIFPDLEGNKLKARIESIARFIQQTVKKYEASADENMKDDHIPWRARPNSNLTKRTIWKSKLSVTKYLSWSRLYFDVIQERCHRVKDAGAKETIPYDSYIKVAQLEGFVTHHTMVMVDEAQDMTPCQADLFWGKHASENRVTYLFGDRHQQLYRFRGASNSFKDMMLTPHTKSFSLTGSFRFGENIATAASLVLRTVNGGPLVGRSSDPGQIHDCSDTFDHGIVLCRSNNGILKYIFFASPNKWCYLDHKSKPLAKIPEWVYNLERCMSIVEELEEEDPSNGAAGETGRRRRAIFGFVYRGATLDSVSDIKEFGEDEGDSDLLRYLDLLLFLKSSDTSLEDFRRKILKSFVPRDDCIAKYDGTIMATIHKSKGLEFDRVFLFNDFNFDLMMNPNIAESRREDEVNTLYVALTRSKSHLYVCPEIQHFLSSLSMKYLDSPSIKIVKTMSHKEMREDWEDQWSFFMGNEDPISSIDDVPWPLVSSSEEASENASLLLDSKMTETEQRQHLRSFVLRYHPDKFWPKYGARIQGNQLEESVKGRLGEVYRQSWNALKALANRGEN